MIMKRKSIIIMLIAIIIPGCSEKDDQNIEKLILEKEKKILDEWGKGHTMIFPMNSADEITYFEPGTEKRIDGKNNFTDFLKPYENTFIVDKYEMLNPKVQVHGDIAVLSYNLVDYSKNENNVEQITQWNSTEVYKKIDGDWKIIHSHWSYTKPTIKP